MPVMSAIESAFCRSSPWRAFAGRTVLAWSLDGFELSGDVLEIGGGSGAMAAGVARTRPDARLTITDLDETMVAAARKRLAPFANVEVTAADVTALPFEGGTFDTVLSFLMLHHVIEWPAALAEAARVLKPGGTLIGYDLTDTVLARAIHKADGSPHRLISPPALEDGLRAAGFEQVVVQQAWRSHLMRFRASISTG